MTVGSSQRPSREPSTTFLKTEDDLIRGTAALRSRVCAQNLTSGSDEGDEEDPLSGQLANAAGHRLRRCSPYSKCVGLSHLDSVRVKLLMRSLWETFSANGTEMIVTKAGR